MTERLRRRNVSNGGKGDDENGHWSDLNGKHFNTSDRDELHLTFFHCFAVILFHVCTFSLAVYAHHYVPETKSGVNRSDFAEWRARAHLHDITSFGSRPAGSYANENLTVAFLLRTLHAIKESSGEGITLDIDVQRPTGSFTIDFLEGFTSHYRNVSNVVARVSSKKNYPAEHSVLVNAHFDSAFGGAGASDDAVSCAAMLEVIRCLAESSTDTAERLHHSLVFLFNGAEENVLQASHGFITQHPWAKYVRVFVNLEAAGAGGREIVFQTGPEHPWLIKTYANSANYPFASIIGQEFFQTGLIPGETDFRIFRDYGHIPGIDIAYVSNGYVYHTRRDLPEAITPGSIQRAGENLLEMVKQLSRSPLVADPSEDRHGAMVFYDFLGLFLVIYPQRIGSILNTLVAVLAFVCIGMKFIKRPGNGGATNKNVLSRYKYRCGNLSVFAFVKALCAILVSWFVALAFVLAIAQVITMNDRSLSWYCKPYLLVGLYVLPAVLTMAGVHYYRATKCQDKDNWWARWDQEEHAFYAVLFLWNLLLSLMTYYDLGSAFLPMLLVAFPLLGRVLLWEIWSGNGYSVNVRKHCNRYVTMYFISNAVPVLICSYILWMHLDFIVPILGRTGSNDAPELLISVFVSLFALVILSYFTNLVYVVNRAKPFALALSGVSLVSVIVVILGFVFPYSAQPWCPKRVIFQHTSRAIHDLHGQLQHEDSGVWVVPFDYLGIKYIDHLPEFKNASTPDLQKGLFGDFPYYMPVNFMFDKTWYIPGPPPQLKIMSTIELISQENHSDGHRRLNFNLDGPSHMSLHISPKLGVRLRNSSLGKLYRRNIPGKGLTVREEYFVYYSHGLYTGPWLFWLELEHVSSYDGVVDIGVVGHYSDEKDSQSTFMNSFIRKLPEWVDATVWASMYERWTF